MSFVNFTQLLEELHAENILLTTEFFDNNPPLTSFVVEETFVNLIPPMELVTTETFANDPPVVENVTTEDFGGYTLNHNVGVFTDPPILASVADPYSIADDTTGVVVYANGLYGYIGSQYFYPARNHRLNMPNTINFNGCIWEIDDPAPFVFTPSYTSDITITVGYHKQNPLCIG